MKKLVSRSLLAVLLTIVLVVGVFTGCNGGAAPTTPDQPTTPETPTTPDQPDTPPVSEYEWPKAMHAPALA